MKKIGILFGQENTFPQAFIDRISQDVPFYRAYLKNAAIGGTAVLNNPFWWSADEKFFNNALAMSVDVAVPNTVLLPSHERPTDTDENSFRNLEFPFNWDSIFEYIGFPAYMKPHSGGGWKSVYRVESPEDLFAKHSETGQLVMMLQEEIEFTEYFRCYYLGGDRVHIMQYEPRNPHHLRYVRDGAPVDKKILDKVHEGVIKLNHALGYDFNTVEFAVRDGVPYAIDFCNPAPDADIHSVGEENFEWIVENAANMAIERAKAHKDGQLNLTWGNFVKDQITPVKKAPAKRVAKKTVRKTPTGKTTPTEATVAKKVASEKKVAPKKAVAKKAPVAKKAAPAKKATTAKATSSKKTAPVRKSSVADNKASTTKKAPPPKKATPAKKSSATAPKAKKVTATKTTAPASKTTATAKKVSTRKAKVGPKSSKSE